MVEEFFRSEAFRMGYLGGDIEAVKEQVRAEKEVRLVEEVSAVKRERGGLQTQIDAYKQRAEQCRARIDAVFATRSPEAPFVWLLERGKLKILERGLDRLREDLQAGVIRESSLRDRLAEEMARLEGQILIERNKGEYFSILTNKDSNHQKGK